MIVLLILTAGRPSIPPAHGQATSPPPVPFERFERFVPTRGNLFIHIHKPAEFDFVLQTLGANQLADFLLEKPQAGKITLQSVATEALLPNDQRRIEELIGGEVGLMVPLWKGIRHAVWVLRAPDAVTIDRWFPRETRKETDLGSGATLIRSREGLMIGARDNVLAVGRKTTDGRLFRMALRLMGGKDSDSLESHAELRRMEPYLPDKPVASFYLGGLSPTTSIPWFEPVDALIAGMYLSEGHIDLAVRIHRKNPRSVERLADGVLERVLALPASSALVAATQNLPPNLELVGGQLGLFFGGWLPSLLKPLDTIPTESHSPGVILAIDAGQANQAGSLQIAALIRTPQAAEFCARIGESFSTRRTAEGSAPRNTRPNNLAPTNNEPANIAPTNNLPATSAPVVQQGTHVGHAVWRLPLCHRPETDDELECLLNIEPSWTHLADWLVIATAPGLVERIIDADAALTPRLSSLPEARALRIRRPSADGIALVQPSRLAGLARQWSDELEKKQDGLATLLWDVLSDSLATHWERTLDLGVEVHSGPGVITILKVFPNTPAAGKLRPGDRIVGVDGRLLDLSAPAEHLDESWHALPPEGVLNLRVLRKDSMVEVLLPKLAGQWAVDDRSHLSRVVEGLRLAASLLNGVEAATVSFPVTDEKHQSVFISLKPAVQSPQASGK